MEIMVYAKNRTKTASAEAMAVDKNRVFSYSGLFFYCYLLILVNELATKSKNINKLKIWEN